MNITDTQQYNIEALKAADDFMALGQIIQQLFRLPQSFCKLRGNCCRVATFKGSLTYEEIMDLACSDDPDAENAKEFLTLFEPYETLEDVRQVAPVFVERVLAREPNASFFKCRFQSSEGPCLIHEDRPTGCHIYPFPHEKTIYHPGCGFEKEGLANWQKIEDIRAFFQKRSMELAQEAQSCQEMSNNQTSS